MGPWLPGLDILSHFWTIGKSISQLITFRTLAYWRLRGSYEEIVLMTSAGVPLHTCQGPDHQTGDPYSPIWSLQIFILVGLWYFRTPLPIVTLWSLQTQNFHFTDIEYISGHPCLQDSQPLVAFVCHGEPLSLLFWRNHQELFFEELLKNNLNWFPATADECRSKIGSLLRPISSYQSKFNC